MEDNRTELNPDWNDERSMLKAMCLLLNDINAKLGRMEENLKEAKQCSPHKHCTGNCPPTNPHGA